MLLKSIQATNFMKYKNLEITDLPNKGIIGIFGENESGKSTIGQAVAFALFGTTTRFQENALAQAIQWDADESEVQIVFLLDDNVYKVVRTLDRKGNQHAALYKGEKETAVKKGAANVTREIERLTRFNFENFRSTFYLAQKEIDLVMKQIQSNASEMIYRMLGFDVLSQACDMLAKEVQSLAGRREKADNELLLSRSLISNVKADSAGEKEASSQLQEMREHKKKLEELLAELEAQIAQSQDICDTRQKLSDSFFALEKSFIYVFHKERLLQAMQLLSSLYALLREEKTRVSKTKSKLQKDEEALQRKLQEMNALAKELNDIKNMVQACGHNLQQRLISLNQCSVTAEDNLHLALRSQEKKISYIASAGLGLFALAGIAGALMLICLLSAAWVAMLVCLLFSVGAMFGVFSMRRQLKDAKNDLAQRVSKRDQAQQQLEVCLHFPARHMGEMEKSLEQLAVPEITKKFQEQKKRFAEIFAATAEVEPIISQLHVDKEAVIKQQKNFDERARKLDSLSKLVESLGKEINFQSAVREEDQKILDDLDTLEKHIYATLDTMQNCRAALHEFENKIPVEITQAWQDYEQWRIKFRTLTNITALSGGTGMLNRLETAFRQKEVSRLTAALVSERESFFALLPTAANVLANLQEARDSRQKCQDDIASYQRQIKDSEAQSHRVTEDLEHKKELIAKIQALNRQIQELDHNIEVNKLTIKFMQETLGSVSSRFAPSVSRVMSKVLPKVTKDRYQHVQVSEDLTLKAFSMEKNDFVDIAELSGGTVDQLYLALRLALSQAVMTAKMGSDCTQFLFFDEPIISFDEDRSTSFLNLLSDYNKNFVQVFIIAPRTYREDLFNMIIATSLNQSELVIVGKSSSDGQEVALESGKATARESKETVRENKETVRENKETATPAKGRNGKIEEDSPYKGKVAKTDGDEGSKKFVAKTESDNKKPAAKDDIEIEYDKDA
jgi:DNA repair exonuclease SbcCD ATPase subunit